MSDQCCINSKTPDQRGRSGEEMRKRSLQAYLRTTGLTFGLAHLIFAIIALGLGGTPIAHADSSTNLALEQANNLCNTYGGAFCDTNQSASTETNVSAATAGQYEVRWVTYGSIVDFQDSAVGSYGFCTDYDRRSPEVKDLYSTSTSSLSSSTESKVAAVMQAYGNGFTDLEVQHAIWYFTNGISPSYSNSWTIINQVNNGTYTPRTVLWLTNLSDSGAQPVVALPSQGPTPARTPTPAPTTTLIPTSTPTKTPIPPPTSTATPGVPDNVCTTQIISVNSGKCMDIEGNSTENGANVFQYGCHGGNNQLFSFTPVAGQLNVFQIRAKHSGKAVDLSGGDSANGTNIHQWAFNTSNRNQWFRLEPVPGNSNTYTIYSAKTNKVLDVVQSSTEDRANIHQWAFSGLANQQWDIKSCVELQRDFGDAPASYETSDTSLIADVDVRLGATVDAEPAGQSNNDATGDDNSGTDDEDGITFVGGTTLVSGAQQQITAVVRNQESPQAYLRCWVDFDGNGSFGGSEMIADQSFNQNSSDQSKTFTFNVPSGASVGMTYARCILSQNGQPTATGISEEKGEVEDYKVTITTPVPTPTNTPVDPCACQDELTSLTLRLSERAATGDTNERIRIRQNSLTGAILFDSATDANPSPSLQVNDTAVVNLSGGTNAIVISVQGTQNASETQKATFATNCSLLPGNSNGSAYIRFEVVSVVDDRPAACYGPTATPTPRPTNTPTSVPTNTPTPRPTNTPTKTPTVTPTYPPTAMPTPQPATLGDKVWKDKDEDGIQDENEPGIHDIEVVLWTDDNGDGSPDTQLRSTTTDENGTYLFTNLNPTLVYVVQFVNDPAMLMPFTQQNSVSDIAKDSDANPTTGITGPITLAPGEINRTIDAGLIDEPAGLGDRVWKDKNANGIQDGDEAGIPGITVNLWTDTTSNGEPDTLVVAMETDENGNYSFTGLNPNMVYFVQVVNDPAMHMPFTSQNSGSEERDDSDVDPVLGITGPIKLNPGQYDPTIDAGLIDELASLGNFVWMDSNANGTQDEGEMGVPGVIVNLWTAQPNGAPIAQIDSTETDLTGGYRFEGLDPNQIYVVQFVNESSSGFTFTSQNQGPDDTNDSNADLNTGITGPIDLAPGEYDPTIDAGFVAAPAALGDRVWKDLNANGLQDADEPGVYGVTVNLWVDRNNDGRPELNIGTTTTDYMGLYQFKGLDPQLTYIVEFVAPSDCTFTSSSQGDDRELDSNADPANGLSALIVLAPGQTVTSIDAGLIYRPDATPAPTNTPAPTATPVPPTPTATPVQETVLPASLGNQIWKDLDANGLQDPGEPGAASLTVNLWADVDKNGTPDLIVQTTTTNGDGRYEFSDLDPSQTYIVQVAIPEGCSITTQDAGDDDFRDSDINADGLSHPVTLAPGEVNSSIDGGLVYLGTQSTPPAASLGDKVWKDLNINGIQDVNEPGVAGVTITLWSDNDGNGTPDRVVATQESGPNGEYLFSGLTPYVAYIVQVAAPDDCALAAVDQSGDDSVDSDIDPQSGVSAPVVLMPGENDSSIDVGLIQKNASLGNTVWKDLNENGLQEKGEPGVAGVLVRLWTDDDGNGTPDTQLTTVATTPIGQYLFANLDPALSYIVQVIAPVDCQLTLPNQGDDELDSDFDPQTGLSGVITLQPGQSDTTVDIGLMEPKVTASLGNYVWLDQNSNGLQDEGEPAIANVEVTLYNAAGDAISMTMTDENGQYSFDNLTPGSYSVGFALPGAGYFFTQPNAGDDGLDSDANTANGKTDATELTAGENDPSWDAGLVTPPLLTVEKSASTEVTQRGDTVIYTIAYGNTGLVEATGVQIFEVIPPNTTFLPEQSSDGWLCDGNAVTPGTVCIYVVGTLSAQSAGAADLLFAVRLDAVLGNDVSSISNQIQIEDDGSHGVSFTGQSIDEVIVVVRNPTALETIDEEDLIMSDFVYIPIIRRNLFRQAPQTLITADEWVAIWACSVDANPEWAMDAATQRWAAYVCGRLVQ